MNFFESLNKFNNKAFLNKNLGSSHRYTAFTLSEVIITLGIIGVVAAMTIPGLMNNVNDQQLKVAWKKAFAELSQASQQIITDNGTGDFSGQCNDWDDSCLRNLFTTKLNTIKTCANSVSEGCTVSDSIYMDKNTQSGSPSNININEQAWPALITNSGFSVKFRAHKIDCSYPNIWQCGWMQVDVNGLKKPNIAGRDIFFIAISKDKLVPFGVQNFPHSPDTDCATGGKGESCSAKYLYE